MRLSYAFLADAAQFTEDGKLWVLGGDLATLRAQEFPHKYPALALVVKFLLRPDECGREHRIRVQLREPTGEALADTLTSAAPEPRTDFPEEEVGLAFVLNYQQTLFPSPGKYSFIITVDDEELGVMGFHVIRPPA
jgi:hypothetical protein